MELRRIILVTLMSIFVSPYLFGMKKIVSPKSFFQLKNLKCFKTIDFKNKKLLKEHCEKLHSRGTCGIVSELTPYYKKLLLQGFFSSVHNNCAQSMKQALLNLEELLKRRANLHEDLRQYLEQYKGNDGQAIDQKVLEFFIKYSPGYAHCFARAIAKNIVYLKNQEFIDSFLLLEKGCLFDNDGLMRESLIGCLAIFGNNKFLDALMPSKSEWLMASTHSEKNLLKKRRETARLIVSKCMEYAVHSM